MIGALMGAWLMLVWAAALGIMRSNSRTQDACARMTASLDRLLASNSRVEAAYASWRSEAILGRRSAPAVDDVPMPSFIDEKALRGSASGTTS